MSNFYICQKGKWDFIVCLLITRVNEKTPSEQAIEGTANAAERQPQFYRGVSAASERRLSAAREDRAEPERMEFINTKNEIQFPFLVNIKINYGRRNCRNCSKKTVCMNSQKPDGWHAMSDQFYFRVYRSAVWLSRWLLLRRAYRLSDAVYWFLPLKLCTVGYDFWARWYPEDLEAHCASKCGGVL